MSSDQPLDAAPEVPPAVEDHDQLNPKEALAIVRRLKQVFSLTDMVLSGDLRGRIWGVHGVAGGQCPTVQEFDTIDDLCKLIVSLRAKHNAEPDNEYFLYIFYGQRWSIQKGRKWQLWDGSTFIPVEGGNVSPYLDMSGGLGDRPDLDSVLPARPQPPQSGPPVDEDIQAAPRADAEVREEPPTIGDEAAAPGADPEVE